MKNNEIHEEDELVSNNLRKRTLNSATWFGIKYATIIPLQIIYFGALARWLDKQAFGECSIVLLTVVLCDLFSSAGLGAALIRQRNNVAESLHPAWSFQLVRGAGLSLLILALAYPIGLIQESDRIFQLLVLASIIPLIDGTISMGTVLISRTMDIKKWVLLEIATVVVGNAVGLYLAYELRSSWALVLSTAFGSVLRTLSSYIVHRYRPRFTLKWKPLRQHLKYGLFYNLACGLSFLTQSMDKFILGKLLGLQLLGLYERSQTLCYYGLQQAPRFLSSTVYASLSNVLQDPPRLKKNMSRFFRWYSLALISASAVLILGAPWIIKIVLGDEYLQATFIFRCFGFVVLFRGYLAAFDILHDLFAKSHTRFQSHCLQFVCLAICLPLGIHWAKLEGAAIATLLSSIVGFLFQFLCLHKDLKQRLGDVDPNIPCAEQKPKTSNIPTDELQPS